MRSATFLLSVLLLSACATAADQYVRDTSTACGGGEWEACQALATVHPQALRDADAIMDGMRRARMDDRIVQGATP